MSKRAVFFRTAVISAVVIMAACLIVLLSSESAAKLLPEIASVRLTARQNFLCLGDADFSVDLLGENGELLNGVLGSGKVKLVSSGGTVSGLSVIGCGAESVQVYCTVKGIKSNTVTLRQAFCTELPILVMMPDGKAGESGTAHLNVYNNGGINTLGCGPTESYSVYYASRGKWSTSFPKPQYGIKILDKSGAEKDVPLLGMAEGNGWVMGNIYADKSLVKNLLAYRLGEEMLAASLEARICEVWVDSDGDGSLSEKEYYGVYLLSEKINRKNVGVSKNGGYIISRDKTDADDRFFSIPSEVFAKWHGKSFLFSHCVKYPTESKITVYEFDYIKNFITELDAKIKTEPITESDYKDYLDIDSYIDAVLVNEVLKNADGFHFSTYFYKNPGGKLMSGPLWDFDLSGGNLVRGDGTLAEPEGFYTLYTEWTVFMVEDPVFVARLKERYAMWRETSLSDENILGIVDEAVDKLIESGAEKRHFERFPELMDGSYNKTVSGIFVDTRSYIEEISVLRGFLKARLNWLDTAIADL